VAPFQELLEVIGKLGSSDLTKLKGLKLSSDLEDVTPSRDNRVYQDDDVEHVG